MAEWTGILILGVVYACGYVIEFRRPSRQVVAPVEVDTVEWDPSEITGLVPVAGDLTVEAGVR